MKKLTVFLGLVLLMFFTVNGVAMAAEDDLAASGPKKPIKLKGTTWKGNGGYVDTTGKVSEGKLTVTFKTQDGYYLSGTLSYGTGEYDISATENPMDPKELRITGIDHSMEGRLFTSAKKQYLAISGHSMATGGTSMGLLLIQK